MGRSSSKAAESRWCSEGGAAVERWTAERGVWAPTKALGGWWSRMLPSQLTVMTPAAGRIGESIREGSVMTRKGLKHAPAPDYAGGWMSRLKFDCTGASLVITAGRRAAGPGREHGPGVRPSARRPRQAARHHSPQEQAFIGRFYCYRP